MYEGLYQMNFHRPAIKNPMLPDLQAPGWYVDLTAVYSTLHTNYVPMAHNTKSVVIFIHLFFKVNKVNIYEASVTTILNSIFFH